MSLGFCTASFHDDHSAYISCAISIHLNNIGAQYNEIGDAEMAMMHYRQALKEILFQLESPELRHNANDGKFLDLKERILVELFGADKKLQAASSITDSNGLSSLLFMAESHFGLLDGTSALQQRVVLIGEELSRSDGNLILATILYNMGLIHQQVHNLDGALQLFESAVESLGSDVEHSGFHLHANIFTCMGLIKFQQGHHEAAVVLLDKAAHYIHSPMRTSKESSTSYEMLPKNRLQLAKNLAYLGHAFFLIGENKKSMINCMDSLRLLLGVLGPIHFDVVRMIFNIGVLHHVQGELEEALQHYQWFIDHAGGMLRAGSFQLLLGQHQMVRALLELSMSSDCGYVAAPAA